MGPSLIPVDLSLKAVGFPRVKFGVLRFQQTRTAMMPFPAKNIQRVIVKQIALNRLPPVAFMNLDSQMTLLSDGTMPLQRNDEVESRGDARAGEWIGERTADLGHHSSLHSRPSKMSRITSGPSPVSRQ